MLFPHFGGGKKSIEAVYFGWDLETKKDIREKLRDSEQSKVLVNNNVSILVY